ncbi:MAG: hypothetical protein HLUCCX14_15260 [Marinobacter excellens HL-55]|uniref:Tetratricopeptide repeat n=1 Tax=Marinobacter excellens HL-55 TaxID=1305731 RepID=A0A0P7Z5U0_9GAMM|nr:MAG: hypothetical protein HLUCCX14_15260 [Marinobacter excellens HL-55]
MYLLRFLATPMVVLCLLYLQGCTSWQINQLSAELPTLGPEKTLGKLEKIDPPDRDRSQYLLNRGLLKFYTGDLAGSRQDLEQAKTIMKSLKAVSLSENFGALTTNETLRSYGGTPSEQVLVHAMLAMGYLFSGDLDGARVEMLQADVTMSQLGDTESVSGQLASVRFLAGLIYEMNGELDDAMISYRRAYQIIRAREEKVPEALATSLLNVSLRRNNENLNDEEYQRYVSEFGREASLPGAHEGEWIVFYHDGVVSNKTETRLSVFDSNLEAQISVVMPHYPQSRYQARQLSIGAGDLKRTEVIEMIEQRAREDLADQSAKTMAAATVRAVTKYQMVRKARESGELGGFLANIAGLISEQADVRSWNMLPSSIQVARLVTPLDASVGIVAKNVELPALNKLGSRHYGVALVTSLNNRLLSYPPYEGLEPIEGQPNEQ